MPKALHVSTSQHKHNNTAHPASAMTRCLTDGNLYHETTTLRAEVGRKQPRHTKSHQKRA